MLNLTQKELAELKSFVNRVMSWGGASGPYGDGNDVDNPKGLATMRRVQAKLNRTIIF